MDDTASLSTNACPHCGVVEGITRDAFLCPCCNEGVWYCYCPEGHIYLEQMPTDGVTGRVSKPWLAE